MRMIQINISQRKLSFTKQEQSIAQAAHARNALAPQFAKLLSTKFSSKSSKVVNSGLNVSESTINRMIVKYSEQLTFQPLTEIRYWFAYTGGLFLEPGYPPLFYARADSKNISPNKSAVAAIGEGISGLVAQRLYHCRLLARPNHDFPDLVMDATDKTYLFESKATLSEKIYDTLQRETQRLVSYVAACNGLDSRPVVGVLVGTTICSDSEYNCDVWELHLCN
jgi:hypothetical protein